MFSGAVCHRLTSISAVGKYSLKAWESVNHLIEDQFSADAVGNICSMNDNSQRKTENIDADVNFASLDFLVPVKALVSVDMVGCPVASGIDDAKTGAFLAACRNTDGSMKRRHCLLEGAFILPLPRIIIDSVVRREVFGEHSPLAAAYKGVKNRIHDFNQRVFALAFVWVKKISIEFHWLSVMLDG